MTPKMRVTAPARARRSGRRPSRLPPAAARVSAYRSVPRRRVEGAGEELWLDWNEATRPPGDLVFRRLARFLADGGLNRYGDPSASQLRRRLAEYTGRALTQIQVFNGSDAALEHLARTYVGQGDHVVLSAPCYDQMRVFVEAVGGRAEHVHPSQPFVAEVATLVARVTPRTRLLYLSNPNNPTGRTYSPTQIEALAGAVPRGLLVVDEAYFEFWGKTAADLIDHHENIVVVRSFSKAFAMAALRCGYLLGSARVLKQVARIRNGKDVNALAQVAAVAALEDTAPMRGYVQEVCRARQQLVRGLRARGLEVVSTPANFVLLRAEAPSALARRLLRRGVRVRDRSDVPGLGPFLRVTVGTRSDVEAFLVALDTELAE